MPEAITPAFETHCYQCANDYTLVPVTPLTLQYDDNQLARRIQPCPQVISRGPAPGSRHSSSNRSPASPWGCFMHPEGRPYFVMNSESNFYVITESNVHDIQTARRISDCLKLVKKELQNQKISIPPRCELFLQLRQDALSCNYYFADHTRKALFWLEDVDAKLLGIPLATSSFHIERLYWMHVEFYPMHHEPDGLSQLVNDLYSIIADALADRLTARPESSMTTYNAETCKQFLKLLARKQGQRMDGRTVRSAARLAGDISRYTRFASCEWPDAKAATDPVPATRECLMLNDQQSACFGEQQQIFVPGTAASQHDWSSTMAYSPKRGNPHSYLNPLESLRIGPLNTDISSQAGHRYFSAQSRDLSSAGQENMHLQRKNRSAKLTTTGIVEARVSIDDIRSNFPHDLSGHVTRADTFPFASGAYGDVYRGRLHVRGKPIDVAIKAHKVYLQHDQHLPKRMKQYRREILVWLKSNHPNVLPLFGVIRDPRVHPEIPAMVTPWIDNGALTPYLSRNEGLSTAQRLVLIDDIARGLQYLHSQQVVHGDLSGSNVLIRGDGSACIGDFGMSTLLMSTGSTFATSRQNKGTVRWMAPELLFSDTATGPSTQSDVYSFGSIMWQIHHHLRRDAQVIFSISKGERPGDFDPKTFTDNQGKFIGRCWSTDPDERPRSEEVVGFTSNNPQPDISQGCRNGDHYNSSKWLSSIGFSLSTIFMGP